MENASYEIILVSVARQAMVEILLPLFIAADDHSRRKATAGEDGV